MEIERKWLFNIKDVPTELSKTITNYTQGYLSINPEVRIRSKVDKNLISMEYSPVSYKLCIKGEGNLTRHEIEKDLSEEEYNALMDVGKISKSDLISKHYYIIPIGKYKLTVGVVDERTENEFSYGEIEFDSEKEANEFIAPNWFGKDVTFDNTYKMKNYWKRTRLK